MDMITFKTSVQDKQDITAIAPVFNLLFGEKKWLFALEEKILKVFSSVPCADVVKYILTEKGFACEEYSPAF